MGQHAVRGAGSAVLARLPHRRRQPHDRCRRLGQTLPRRVIVRTASASFAIPDTGPNRSRQASTARIMPENCSSIANAGPSIR